MGLPFLLEEICGPILGLYKSLTDTWMWKLRLRPRNSQKEKNIYAELPLHCITNIYSNNTKGSSTLWPVFFFVLCRAWCSPRPTLWRKGRQRRQCLTSGGWPGRSAPHASSWSPGPSISSGQRNNRRIFPSTSKKWRKFLISNVMWLLYDFLSLKNDVNVPSKKNKHKNLAKKKKKFGIGKSLTKRAGSGSVSKMSRIRNTA